jgi:hypothetical protein
MRILWVRHILRENFGSEGSLCLAFRGQDMSEHLRKERPDINRDIGDYDVQERYE